MSSKMFLYFFSGKEIKVLMKTSQDFSPYTELQWTPNDNFSAASKGYKRY